MKYGRQFYSSSQKKRDAVKFITKMKTLLERDDLNRETEKIINDAIYHHECVYGFRRGIKRIILLYIRAIPIFFKLLLGGKYAREKLQKQKT